MRLFIVYRGTQFSINLINSIQFNSIWNSRWSIQFNCELQIELIELLRALIIIWLIPFLSMLPHCCSPRTDEKHILWETGKNPGKLKPSRTYESCGRSSTGIKHRFKLHLQTGWRSLMNSIYRREINLFLRKLATNSRPLLLKRQYHLTRPRQHLISSFNHLNYVPILISRK